jgi:hypothetical protein
MQAFLIFGPLVMVIDDPFRFARMNSLPPGRPPL